MRDDQLLFLCSDTVQDETRGETTVQQILTIDSLRSYQDQPINYSD